MTEKQFQRLCDLLGNPRPVKQENRYYDTEDWKIRRQYGSMRIRTINNKHIFTLKIRKNSDTVMEYELPVSENSLFALYNRYYSQQGNERAREKHDVRISLLILHRVVSFLQL